MDLDKLVDRLEKGGVVGSEPVAGLGEAFFARLLALHGSQPGRQRRLGRRWRFVLPACTDQAWVWRAGGVYERTVGHWAESAEAFLRAGAVSADPVDRLSFQVGAIDSLARQGELSRAVALGNRLASGLKKQGRPDLAARAELNLGNALVYQDEMDKARRVLSRALATLESAGLTTEAASARMAISSSHLFGGDPKVAEALAQEVLGQAVGMGAGYLADLARLNLALAAIQLNRPEEAHRSLLSLRDSLADSPADVARVEEYLGDAYMGLNLWPEGEDAYRSAHRLTRTRLHRANCQLGMAETQFAQGRTDKARKSALRAARLYRSLGNDAWESACLLMTEKASGDGRALARAESLAKKSPFHLCRALLALSEAGTDRTVEALRLIRRYGYSGLEWRVHAARARHAPNPATHHRRAFVAIRDGRLATRSLAARTSFLKDKGEALEGYFAWLLDNPTPAHVAEFVRAVTQVRSVTLLDEILASAVLPESVLATLTSARERMSAEEREEPKGGSRLRRTEVPSGKFRRDAADAFLGLDLALADRRAGKGDGIIVSEAQGRIHTVADGTVVLARMDTAELADALRGFWFEIVAPMTDKGAPSRDAERAALKVADAFGAVWDDGNRPVCPDALTWRVPWSLCAWLKGSTEEKTLLLHPDLGGGTTYRLARGASAVVWLGEAEDLPFARKEAEDVAGGFGKARVVTSRREALETLQGSVDVLHVVSHAVHRRENPMLSTIEFPDGPVSAYEIARSPLRVELATLSACETGALSLATRNEPDGLARAFVACGAKHVVASQWPLDDEAGYRLFTSLFAGLADGKTVGDAVSLAKCITRDWKTHPYYWAALAMYAGFTG